ncbi:MAG: diphthine synthase [Thermofilum sp.]|jgi:diphthine synthase|nr:diphthine synthase [Thermofilum sp.]MCC6059140.1 diphthine synthase [Thermofilum sp.]
MLVLAGLGLYSTRDIPLGVLELLRRADVIYFEGYTSLAPFLNRETIERLCGREVKEVKREDLEERSARELLAEAAEKLVVLLTVGNPLLATTHAAIVLEAKRRGVPFLVLPSASVIDGIICATGLHIYRFGRVTTLVFPDEEKGFYPLSTYYAIKSNMSRGLHTLVLLDIKAEEGRYMNPGYAAQLLLRLESMLSEGVLDENTLAIVVARATAPDQEVKVCTLGEAAQEDFGQPPFSVIIPGLLHATEIEYLQHVHGAPPEVMVRWNERVRKRFSNTLEV